MNIRRLFAGLFMALFAAAAPAFLAFAQGPTVQDLMLAGQHDFQSGNYTLAERRYRAALELVRATNNSPADTATIFGSLAQILLAQTRLPEAEEFYDAAMKIAADEPIDPRIKAMLMVGISSLYAHTQRAHLAEPILQDGLRLTQEVFGDKSPQTAVAFKHLGIVFGLTKKFSAAEKMFREALKVQDALPNGDPAETAAIMNSLAGIYILRGQWDKAEPLFLRSVALMEVTLGADHPDVAAPLENLAEYYAGRGTPAAAETALRRAVNIRLKAFGPESLAVALTNARLAAILTDQKKYEEARTLFLSSLSIQEQFDADKSPAYAKTLERFAMLLRNMEDRRQAEVLEARANYVRARLSYTVPATQLGR